MKKAIALLLSLCLALSLAACTPPAAPEAAQTSGGTEAQTASPAPEPTTEASAEPSAAGYQAQGTPTAGGVRVHTDASAYKPYAGSGAVYTRRAEGVLDRFLPAPDYGAVYPYAAARVVDQGENGEVWNAGVRWGFIDRSGRILTDGIYMEVEPLSNSGLWLDRAGSILPFWRVSQVKDVESYKSEDGAEWPVASRRYGLIAMDGSFALDCVYTRIIGLEKGFACVEEGAESAFTVYDETGKPLFDASDLMQDPEAEWWNLDYGDGLYCYTTETETADHQYITQCCYYDSAGNRVLGPYTYGGPFQDGLACVSADGECYGYIDRSGRWITEPCYEIQSFFQNGRALQTTLAGRNVVLDIQGNEILQSAENEWFIRAPCGFCRFFGEAGDINRQYYDPDGNLLISGDASLQCVDADRFYDANWESAMARLRCLSTGQELKLPRLDRIERGVSERNGELCLGYVGWNYSKNLRCFIPQDLSGVQTTQDPPLPRNFWTSNQSLKDPCTGEQWYLHWNGSAWVGLSEGGERLRIPVNSGEIQIRGGLVCVMTDLACLYLKPAGDIVFSYPLENED